MLPAVSGGPVEDRRSRSPRVRNPRWAAMRTAPADFPRTEPAMTASMPTTDRRNTASAWSRGSEAMSRSAASVAAISTASSDVLFVPGRSGSPSTSSDTVICRALARPQSMARLRTILALHPLNAAKSPRKVRRSRAIPSQASAHTSSASAPTRTRAYRNMPGWTAR